MAGRSLGQDRRGWWPWVTVLFFQKMEDVLSHYGAPGTQTQGEKASDARWDLPAQGKERRRWVSTARVREQPPVHGLESGPGSLFRWWQEVKDGVAGPLRQPGRSLCGEQCTADGAGHSTLPSG